MARRLSGRQLQRFANQRFSPQIIAPLMSSSPMVSSLSQPGLFESRYWGRRFLHHRLQSAWDAAKTNVARVPSLVSPRYEEKMSFCRKVTSVLLFGLMGVGGASIYDDYLIFQQCSKSAMERATSDPQLKTILGEHIEQGPWYEATMGVDHEGHSASCSFPVTGSLGTANLHLRAVRFEEKWSWLAPYMPGIAGGRWEVLMLEALMPRMISGARARIDLMQPNVRLKVGDRGGGGPCGPLNTEGLHEV